MGNISLPSGVPSFARSGARGRKLPRVRNALTSRLGEAGAEGRGRHSDGQRARQGTLQPSFMMEPLRTGRRLPTGPGAPCCFQVRGFLTYPQSTGQAEAEKDLLRTKSTNIHNLEVHFIWSP